jgi:hypothetical protein
VSAGLPGLGLGGLFFIFSALLAPFRQLWRTFSGRSRPGEWAMVGRQFAQATVMVAAVDLSLRLAYLGIAAAGLGNPPSAVSATVIPLTLIGITSALLVAVLATAKFADLAVRLRTAELPRVPDVVPRATPLRSLALGSVVAVAWLALLAAGASELSPLQNRGEERATGQRPRAAGDPRSRSARSHGRPLTEVAASPTTATPGAVDAEQPTAEPGHEPKPTSSEAEIVLQPAVATPAPAPGTAPTHQKQTSPAAPPAGAPSAPPAGSGSEPPSVANPPHATGPPASAGPGGPPAPEHAGPPEGSPPPHGPPLPKQRARLMGLRRSPRPARRSSPREDWLRRRPG